MLTLTEAFRKLRSVKVLVIGDFLLDVYTKGCATRISPEAPIPVLLVSEVIQLPGGAGNVALNLKALGAEVSLIGRVGADQTGKNLIKLLLDEGIETKGLFREESFTTPLKNRFIADGQQLIRADYEVIEPITEEIEAHAIAYIKKHLSEFDIVCVSDYGKGFLSENLLSLILKEGKKIGVKVIVDPKGRDFSKYDGAYLIKPNNKEAYLAADAESVTPLEEVAKKIFSKVGADYLLITRSDKGMTLFSKEDLRGINFTVTKKSVADVTGAGDTALAMIAFGIANELTFDHAISLANIASGISVETVGCKAVKLSEISRRLFTKNRIHRIFNEIR